MPLRSRQHQTWSRRRAALFVALGMAIWMLIAAGVFLLARGLTA